MQFGLQIAASQAAGPMFQLPDMNAMSFLDEVETLNNLLRAREAEIDDSFFNTDKFESRLAFHLRGLLLNIIADSEQLLTNFRETVSSFEDIVRVNETANRAFTISHRMSSLARCQHLTPRAIHIDEILSNLKEVLCRIVGKNCDISLSHDNDHWLACVDVGGFEAVIVNLVAVLSSAANEKGGEIAIKTLSVAAKQCAEIGGAMLDPNDYVQVEIGHDGCRLALTKINEQLGQDFSTVGEYNGSAGFDLLIGLATVRRSGGTIFTQATSDTGLVFRIFLPRFIPAKN